MKLDVEVDIIDGKPYTILHLTQLNDRVTFLSNGNGHPQVWSWSYLAARLIIHLKMTGAI